MQRERGTRHGEPLPGRVVVHASLLPAGALLVIHLAATVFAGYRLATAIVLSVVSSLGVFVSLLWHELAHTLAARAERVATTAATLYPFGGVSLGVQAPSPFAGGLVAFAGPVASGLFAAVAYGASAQFRGIPSALLWTLAASNAAITTVNLIPAFPFDGGRIVHAIIHALTHDVHRATRTASRAGEGFGALMAVAGAVSFLRYLPTLRGAPGLWAFAIGVLVLRLARGGRRASAVAAALEAPAGSWATPFAGRVRLDELVPDGQGLFAVADAGRLAGVAPASAAGELARDAMLRWTPDIACRVSDPLRVALKRMASSGADVVVVLDEGGIARGVLSSAGVGDRLRGVT